MDFKDLLNKELPSHADDPYGWMTESEDELLDEENNGSASEGCGGSANEGCKNRKGYQTEDDDEDDDDEYEDDEDDEEEGDIDDIDIDGLDDDDLDDIDVDDLETEDDEKELDDEERADAQRTMNLAATPAMLNKELSDEKCCESFADEIEFAIDEGLLTENSIADFYNIIESDDIFQERAFAAKTKVQFNEADRKKQLFTIGVYAAARAHNDKDYYKLEKLWKAKRILKKRLRARYRGEALRLVKNYVKRLKASKSGVLSKLGKKLSK